MPENLIRQLKDYRRNPTDLVRLPNTISSYAASRISKRMLERLENCLEVYLPSGSNFELTLSPEGYFDIWIENAPIKNIFITENTILLDGKPH